ncbi:hypothetical protein DICPUDRAFT_97905 [Dictyostelium purpureum]|uniref:SnoaL-like domain-containing protein n=1 Tax=Dictyostelium purpureum TaxID=5786 RepID=F0ZKV8_DICPU|nr:uncharacterized protein DICPUDRAFT_97905 [Dictyostelium purpureum]EGC35428.1 hypothetical protein DICPUDRAFT_97905 [Dictyostelium purpureum]|eukprot:XP_003288041.1 hypothetical protein DICPUDRAFT_97905 [Dictyostelium purpureum]
MDKTKNIFFEEEEYYSQDNFNIKNEEDETLKVHRKKCEDLVNNLKTSLEQKDFNKFDDYFEPKSVLNRCNEEVIGRNLIKKYIEDIYNNEEIHLYNVRLLIDSRQRHVACEWITRRKDFSKQSENDTSLEQGMAAWYIKLSPNDYKIRTWYIWIDKAYIKIDSMDAPLPNEHWTPAPVQYYTRKDVSDIVRDKLEKFEKEDLDEWSSCLSDDLVICPPFNHVAGKNCCIDGAKLFFDNFEHTSISKIEQLYDETKPNWTTYLQIFSTTNRKTGQKGEDIDFVFNEILTGKIRYWRSYFNSTPKGGNQENTFKFFIQTLTQCIEKEDHKSHNRQHQKSSFIKDDLKTKQQQQQNTNQKIIGSGQN